MPNHIYKPGDRVVILRGCGCVPFYKDRDTCELTHCDKDGDWWARFHNEKKWCIGKPEVHFTLSADHPTTCPSCEALKEELVKAEDQLSRDEKALRYLADKLNLTFAPTKEGADSLVRDAISELEALRAGRGKEKL